MNIKQIFVLSHPAHGLVLKFERFFYLGLIGDLENILFPPVRQNMIILVSFAGKGPEQTANPEEVRRDLFRFSR